jgi:Domain of unknown function (DUF3576)
MTYFYRLAFVALCGLTACSSLPKGEKTYPKSAKEQRLNKIGSLSGNDNGFTLFGGKKDEGKGGTTGIGVNAYLWRATLDTLSFMPLSSADPFGGVIITDWYNPPETPKERFKLNAFIKDQYLRSDGISVKVFRQVKTGATWQDSPSDKATGTNIENAILTRARALRIAADSPS